MSAYGYTKEVTNILSLLARRLHCHILLVGQEGVGSFGIAKEVGTQIQSDRKLSGRRVLYIHIDELLQSVPSEIDQLHLMEKTVSDIERVGSTVVVITGMKDVFAGKYALTAEDILHPFFSSSAISTITILSDEEYHEHIAHHPDLKHFVEIIPIQGLSIERTKKFLRTLFDGKVSHELLDEVVEKTKGILSHIPYPKRAIDLIQELIASNTVSKEHVQHFISKKVGFDVRRLDEVGETDIVRAISMRVVSQKEALRAIAHACIRARNKQGSIKHPIVSLLFEGSKGVGKTETAKALAQLFFGSEKRVLYLNAHTILTELPQVITEHPFSVLLLQGLEELSSQCEEQLVSALQNGYVRDKFGRIYFTTHMVIIGMCRDRSLCSEHLVQSFDGIIPFTNLASHNVQSIAERKLRHLNGRLQMEHNVSLDITPELIEYLVEQGYSEEYGAHAMQDVLRNTIEQTALQAISLGKVVPGGKIRIDPRQFA